MEEKTRSTSVQALHYGIITGAAMIVLSLILYIANLYMNRALGFLSLLLLIGGMAWGTLEYRKTYLNGFISYGKAFSLCFMIGLYAAILSAIYTFVFAEFIYPGFTQELLEKARENMISGGQEMSEQQIETALEWTKKFTTPVMITVWGFVTSLFFSAVIGLIAAIFLKKEDKSLNSMM
jgi:hypothetical protein